MSTTGPEDFETYVRDVMQSPDTRPAGFTAGQIVAGGRRRRRQRNVATSGIALVAAVGLAVGVPALLGGGRGRGGIDGDPAATPAATSPSAAAPGAGARAVQVVSTPKNIDIGGGFHLKLTGDSVELTGQGSSVGPNYAVPHAALSLLESGRVIASLYGGPGHVARAIVTVDGTAYPASVVEPAGQDWSVAYVVLPVDPGTVSVTVYDAAGKELASGPDLAGP